MQVCTRIDVLWSTLILHIKPVLQAHLGAKKKKKKSVGILQPCTSATFLPGRVWTYDAPETISTVRERLYEENKRTSRHTATSNISTLCPWRQQFLHDFWLSHISRYNNAAGMTKQHSPNLQSMAILAPAPIYTFAGKGRDLTQISNTRKKGNEKKKRLSRPHLMGSTFTASILKAEKCPA